MKAPIVKAQEQQKPAMPDDLMMQLRDSILGLSQKFDALETQVA